MLRNLTWTLTAKILCDLMWLWAVILNFLSLYKNHCCTFVWLFFPAFLSPWVWLLHGDMVPLGFPPVSFSQPPSLPRPHLHRAMTSWSHSGWYCFSSGTTPRTKSASCTDVSLLSCLSFEVKLTRCAQSLVVGLGLAHKFLLSKEPCSQGDSLLLRFTGSNPREDRTSPHLQGRPSAKATGGFPV